MRAIVACVIILLLPFLIPMAISAGPTSCTLCLFGPDNMVFDHAGHIYLTDTDSKRHSRLLELSSTGSVLKQWNVFTMRAGARNGPEGIALTKDGTILVTDGGASRILAIQPNSTVVRTFAADAPFEDLGHLAVDSKGNVYVAEAAPTQIYKFSSSGHLLARWRRPKGKGANDWSGPQTIAVQPNDNVVIEDWANRRIQILSPSGQTLTTFGGPGRTPGHFLVSAGLAVNSRGNIYVADIALHRLQEFDRNGRFVRVIPSNKRPLFTEGPSAVAVDRTGNLYVADGQSVLKLSTNGTPLARLR